MQYLHHIRIFAFTMKHKIFISIIDPLTIYHEIRVFKKKNSPYNII